MENMSVMEMTVEKDKRNIFMKPFKQVLLAGMRAKTAMSLLLNIIWVSMLKVYNEFESRVEY